MVFKTFSKHLTQLDSLIQGFLAVSARRLGSGAFKGSSKHSGNPGLSAGWKQRCLLEIARYFYFKGVWDQVLSIAGFCLKLKEDSAAAYALRGRAYLKKRLYTEARADFEKAIGLKPQRAQYHHQLGQTLHKLNDLYAAQMAYEKAMELNPKKPAGAFAVAVMCYNQGDLFEARKWVDRYMGWNGQSPDARELSARLYWESENFSEALAEIRMAQRLAPEKVRLQKLAAVYAKQKTSGKRNEFSMALCFITATLKSSLMEEAAQLSARDLAVKEIFFAHKAPPKTAFSSRARVQYMHGWKECVKNASTDYVCIINSQEPFLQKRLAHLRSLLYSGVGLASESGKPAKDGLSCWSRPLLQLCLDSEKNPDVAWEDFAFRTAPKLRSRTGCPTKAMHAFKDPVCHEGPVWLYSTKGTRLYGGVEHFLIATAELYKKMGYKPVIVGNNGKNAAQDPLQMGGIDFYQLPESGEAFRSDVLEKMPVLIHATTGTGYELAALLEGINVRLVYGTHFWRDMYHGAGAFNHVDVEGRFRTEFTNLCLGVDQGYSNSLYVRDLIENLAGISQPVMYSLPLDRKEEEPFPKEKGEYALLMNARPDKGFLLVLEIARQLPHISFVVIASQISREEVEGHITASGVQNTAVLDWVENTEKLYRRARVVLVPSYAFIETFSRVTIEAQRHGVPVVGSDRGNIPLLLKESGVALPENAEAWTEEIGRLFSDDSYHERRVNLALENSARYAFSSQHRTLKRIVGGARRRFAVGVGAGIGNMIQCTPAIRRLAEYLGHPVDILMMGDYPGCAPLFAGAEWVNTVLANSDYFESASFDGVFLFNCFGELLPPLNTGQLSIARQHFSFELTQDMHEAHFNLMCLRELLGVPFVEKDVGRYFVGDFKRGEPVPGRIGIHAGCKSGKWLVKKWPHYESLVERLAGRGFEVVSVGSAEEHVAGTGNATGTDLKSTIRTLLSCDYFIANDSGIMHLADALHVPLTAVFGPTSVVKNGPLSPRSQVVALAKACAPCQFNKDRFEKCKCLGELGVDEVEMRVLSHRESLK